jgi:hypothetical protein
VTPNRPLGFDRRSLAHAVDLHVGAFLGERAGDGKAKRSL